MSEFLDKLATTLATPENNRKLSTFLGVLQTLVSTPQAAAAEGADTFTTFLGDGNLLKITKNGITVSENFLQNLGSFELVISGAPLWSNMQVSLTAVAPTEPADSYANTIEFVKEGNKYRPNIGSGFIDCIDEIGIVNLLKRPVLEPGAFTFVKNYFQSKGFKVFVVGDEPISAPAVVATVSSIGASVPSVPAATQVVYLDKIVVTEKVVEVVKHVVTEKLVEVEKIVIKEVPIYLPAKVPVVAEPVAAPVVEPTKEAPVEKKKGPIEEPSDDDEGTGSDEAEESDEEQEEESSEEQENGDEESEPEEEESAEKTTKKLKGMWLNDDHTILKSGDFVYRVNKKIKGPPELIAIGRWNKEEKKRVPLKKGDDKIVKSLGNKIK